MKKIIGFILLFLSLNSLSIAQDFRIGISLAPTFSFNQAKFTGSGTDPGFSGTGSSLQFLFGPTFDINIKDEKYYFNSGLYFITKRAGAEAGGDEVKFGLQYLQLPATVKLFTNEIFTDARVFFQMGSGIEIKISETDKTDGGSGVEGKAFREFDIPIIFAVGLEYDLGENQIFGSIGYQRGLIDAAKNNLADDLRIANQIIPITVGFMF